MTRNISNGCDLNRVVAAVANRLRLTLLTSASDRWHTTRDRQASRRSRTIDGRFRSIDVVTKLNMRSVVNSCFGNSTASIRSLFAFASTPSLEGLAASRRRRDFGTATTTRGPHRRNDRRSNQQRQFLRVRSRTSNANLGARNHEQLYPRHARPQSATAAQPR